MQKPPAHLLKRPPTATPPSTPTPAQLDQAFEWLLDKPDDTPCTIGPVARRAIAKHLSRHFDPYLNNYREVNQLWYPGTPTVETIADNLELERLPDENGNLRFTTTFTGPMPPITYNVYTVYSTPTLFTATGANRGGRDACVVAADELIAFATPGEAQVEFERAR